MAGVKVGEVFKTNQGCECTVIEYNGAFNVVVKFNDKFGYVKRVRTGDLKKGEVGNPFHPTVFGVGFLGGEGPNYKYIGKSREYMFWKGLIERSYSKKNSERNPTYENCFVEEIWHNLRNFGDWCQSQVGFSQEGWQLDKDILSDKEVKCYGPGHCVFVPAQINTLFIVPSTKHDGLPTGVSYSKERKKYVASCGGGGFTVGLGRYTTPEQAYEVYKAYKVGRIDQVIYDYQGQVDQRVIDKLKVIRNNLRSN